MYKILELHNPGVLIGKLPVNIYENLLEKIKDERLKLKSVRDELTGSIENAFITPHVPEFIEFIHKMYSEWKLRFNISDEPYEINPVWTNYMQKGEFNPYHYHPGSMLAFVVWMEIPYNIDDELNFVSYDAAKNAPRNSCFEFFYSTITGELRNEVFEVGKEHEGTILMFPPNLYHCVYPFRTCDGERISIAGNIQKVNYKHDT